MLSADEHRRAPLLWLLVPFGAGLAAAAVGAGMADRIVASAAALFGLAAIVAVSRNNTRTMAGAWTVCFAMAAFGAGFLRMRVALDEQPRWRGLPPRETTLEVELTRVFAPRPGETRRSCLALVVSAPSPVEDLVGQRLFFATEPPPPSSPDASDNTVLKSIRLRVRGVIQSLDAPAPPKPASATAAQGGSGGASADGFDDFLRANGVRFRLARAGIVAVTSEARPLPRFWDAVEQRFESILRHGLPQKHPATGVYVAMFLGGTSELTGEQRDNYLHTGTMHLFAISGLHIAIIALCLQSLLSLLRVPPRPAGLAALAMLFVFVEATGGTPSARRALLMVAFVWGGRLLRRPANAVASLIAAAFVVLAVDPLALLSASFQLSYAVVAVLLLYGVPLNNVLVAHWSRVAAFRDVPEADRRWWQNAIDEGGRSVIALVSTSVAATLASTPLCVAYFGIVSPGGVLANLALVPVTGYAIVAGFASILCGLAGVTVMSSVFNHAGALILAVVDEGARWAAAMPGMFFNGSFAAGWIAPALTIALLALCLAGTAIGWRRMRGALLVVPPAVLVIALVFLVTRPAAAQQSAHMKSAYELAMERLKKSDPDSGVKLTDAQKAKLAEIDRVFQGKIAEREIFLKKQLDDARAKGEAEEVEKIQKQIANERARLEEEREDEKNRIRRAAEK